MTEADLAARVADVLETDAEAFQKRAEAGAAVIIDHVESGVFDNPQAIVGFEYEFYAVDDETCALTRVPRRLLSFIRFEKELGLHNAEMSTSPQPLNADGLAAQEAEVRSQLQTAQECVQAEGMRLVSDGMWTIPPVGETAREYLTNSVNVDGVQIASNMSDSPRYHAMGQPGSVGSPGKRLDAPHISLQADTVMPESLITSIQPHYQVPQARDLPTYFRYALRIAPPLLALGVNSPFFPADLYDEDATAEDILADAWLGSRISVFESVLNDPGGQPKVAFPRDVDSVEQAVDRIATDPTIVPMPPESTDRFDDDFAAFRLKHGTYWRWVRPVFEAPTRSSAHARIEFRPIGGQPTVRDSIAFLAAFAGLMESLPRREHPVRRLDWERTRDSFYAAMRDGLDADVAWITNAGEETTDATAIYADLLDHARDGLKARGLSDEQAATYLYPLRKRARHQLSPARWKVERVQENLDSGASFPEALESMQRTYVEKQTESLLSGSFADWIDDESYRAEP